MGVASEHIGPASDARERRGPVQRLGALIQKFRNFGILVGYLLGKDAPAHQYLEEFRQTATQQPVPGKLGRLRGYSSLTVVADYDVVIKTAQHEFVCPMVVKFESRPGKIPLRRLVDEQKNEELGRRYLGKFMPKAFRVIGHGMRNEPSALVYQQRVEGKLLRHTALGEITGNRRLLENLLEFCDAVLKMHTETGQVPDLAGTLPRVDWLTNIFWFSKHIVLNLESGDVWLVDTGAQSGQESTREGPLIARFRTQFRLQTLKLYERRLLRCL